MSVGAGLLVKAGFDLVDKLFTSDEEKAAAKHRLLELDQRGELAELEARAGIVAAEAKSEHWLTAAWRPIVMLTFAGVVVFDQVLAPILIGFGAPPVIDAEVPEWIGKTIQYGLAGYVAGRSGEKGIKAWKGR